MLYLSTVATKIAGKLKNTDGDRSPAHTSLIEDWVRRSALIPGVRSPTATDDRSAGWAEELEPEVRTWRAGRRTGTGGSDLAGGTLDGAFLNRIVLRRSARRLVAGVDRESGDESVAESLSQD